MLAAAWVGASATAGLLIGAILTAIYAVRTFRAQGNQLALFKQQVALLEQQRDDEQALRHQQVTVLSLWAQEMRDTRSDRTSQAAQGRRAQAEHILVWQEHQARDPRMSQVQAQVGWAAAAEDNPDPPRPVVVAHVQNTSGKPITELKYRWLRRTALHCEIRRTAPVLANGEDEDIQELPPGVTPATFNVVVYFRDASRVFWRRRAQDGALDEIPADVVL